MPDESLYRYYVLMTETGAASNLLNILLGVPQGSILGPLLFVIQKHDLPTCSKLFSNLFADDTNLLASKPTIEKLFSFINEEFRKVAYYFRAHRLVLHPDKTVYMLFSNSNIVNWNAEIFIDNNNYTEISVPNLEVPILCTNDLPDPKVKFLGVVLDPTLNFKKHIKTISSKISNAIFHLRCAKNLLSQDALTTLFTPLFIHT
jgi:hypothetical protein